MVKACNRKAAAALLCVSGVAELVPLPPPSFCGRTAGAAVRGARRQLDAALPHRLDPRHSNVHGSSAAAARRPRGRGGAATEHVAMVVASRAALGDGANIQLLCAITSGCFATAAAAT